MNLFNLTQLYLAQNAAEKALVEAVKKQFPVGSDIHWLHGKHWQSGTVEMNTDWSPRVRVRNHRTENLVWVDVSSLLFDYSRSAQFAAEEEQIRMCLDKQFTVDEIYDALPFVRAKASARSDEEQIKGVIKHALTFILQPLIQVEYHNGKWVVFGVPGGEGVISEDKGEVIKWAREKAIAARAILIVYREDGTIRSKDNFDYAPGDDGSRWGMFKKDE